MFRKPKRSAKKAGLRRKPQQDDDDEEKTVGIHHPNATTGDEDDDDEDDRETSIELQEARKRAKLMDTSHNPSFKRQQQQIIKVDSDKKDEQDSKKKLLLHQYEEASTKPSQKDLATATNEYHPTDMGKPDPKRNKFLAGPIRAPTNIRTTCRFDYQPDICKDYKDTGFCGFGDTCIYLHDRGDTMSGWQLEQKWEQEKEQKKRQQERQMEAFMNGKDPTAKGGNENDNDNDINNGVETDDGLPFACYLCRKAFEDPVVTPCGHYFCQQCLHPHNQGNNNQCPICQRDTHGVMNQPTKLLAKKRKLLGRSATWQEFMDSRKNG
mmetsp:Transcript_13126/g.21148  ORF Transcript_13126/g.21148 Transcript_13126/m.21148 type:complete len:323 (-) Transcript_13126:878-1846(-)